jgi:hypothetical protein
MRDTDTMDSPNKFSYRIDFRYKKFDKDLKSTDFINSILIVTVDEPVPEPMQRVWTTIIGEINPNYFKIEIMDVKNIKK